jgi:hypothetical protein
MVAGFVIMVWITGGAFMLGKSHIPLPFNADNCLDSVLALGANVTANVAGEPGPM